MLGTDAYERLKKGDQGGTDMVEIFSDWQVIIRLVGAILTSRTMNGPLYGTEVLTICRKPGHATSVFDVSDDGTLRGLRKSGKDAIIAARSII